MKNIKKRIIAFASSALLFFSSNLMIASANPETLRLNFIVSETYIYKNGLTDGTGTHLNTAFSKVSSAYYAAAGIHVVKKPFIYSNSTIINTSVMSCPSITSTNYTHICNCVTNSNCSNTSGLHHTNGTYLKTHSLPNGSLSTHINMLLIGNRMCNVFSGTGHEYDYGLTWKTNYASIVRDTNYTDSNGNNYSLFSSVMAHEIGHLYNVTHHFNSTSNTNCLWGSGRHSYYVAKHLSMCSNCLNTIKSNKSLYNQ